MHTSRAAIRASRLSSRSYGLRSSILISSRSLATRGEFDSPFDHLPKRAPKSWFNWKTTAFFFLTGSYLAYNESLFEFYESVTDTTKEDNASRMKLEYELKHLPIYEALAHPRPGENWVQMKSWENLDHNVLDGTSGKRTKKEDEYVRPALTNNTLAQKGGIAIEPVIFHNLDTDEGVHIIHVGYRLCGFPLLVHGGILATLLNETFKRNASLSKATTSNLKGDFKVENLSISYRYPSFANQFLIVKTKPSEKFDSNDKEINLQAVIESQNGKVLVQSEAFLVDTGRESKAIKESKHKGEKKWWPL